MAAHIDPVVVEAVMVFLNTRDPYEQKSLVEERQSHLLTDAAEQVMSDLLEQYRDDSDAVDALVDYRALLSRCRRDGIDAAYSWWERLNTLLVKVQRPFQSQEMPNRVQLCEEALELLDRNELPHRWASTHGNLAISLVQGPQGSRVGHLERAVRHYNKALEVFTRQAYPVEWAMTMKNLGNALQDLEKGGRAENIEQALECYRRALEVFTRVDFQPQWADVQNGMGLAYADRIRGDRADNLERALHHYKLALEEIPDETERSAGTQFNLAAALVHRIHGDSADNLEEAIYLLKSVEEILTARDFPDRWASLQSGLGTAYARRIKGVRADNLQKSIYNYSHALDVVTREMFPMKWAHIHHNLANVCCESVGGEIPTNVEQGIHHYQQALMVYSREESPEFWADAMNGLGSAYASSLQSDEAIRCFQAALEVYTPERFPARYQLVQRNLGDEYFSRRDWKAAHTAYDAALQMSSALLAAAHTEAGRRAEVSEVSALYARSAYSLLKTGKPAEAFLQLEKGKTRLLSAALALNDADTARLPPTQRKNIVEGRKRVRQLEAEMRRPLDLPARRSNVELGEMLERARASLDQAIEAARAAEPDFIPHGLNLPDILELIPEDGALVAPLVTLMAGSAVFVIPHDARNVGEEHVLEMPALADMATHMILGHEASAPSAWRDWREAYTAYRRTGTHAAFAKWLNAMDAFTGILWQALMGPIHLRLSELGVKRVIIMPQGGLQLLPLHAAWREVDGRKRAFLDDYEVAYAPSAYALQVCRRRAREREGHAATVVGINTYADPGVGSLVNAVLEAKAVAQLLGASLLIDEAATQQAITESVPGHAYLHFSCHGYFNWREPLASGLVCHDGHLTLTEIIGKFDPETQRVTRLHLDVCRLVTLSACETGIIDVRQSPDEYVGLPAGFLQAGAPAVISSLWTVDDHSTALLMDRFYRNHFEKKMGLAEALREAQLWLRHAMRKELADYYQSFMQMSADEAFAGYAEMMLEEGKPDEKPYDHPFFWAPFTFTGA